MIRAIAFDFNGVIVDDEPIHYEAFRIVLEKHGVTLSREAYWQKYLAFDDRGALEELLLDFPAALSGCDRTKFLADKVAAYMRLVGVAPPFFPGAVETVRALAQEFPMAIVSGARREEIEVTLQAGGIADCFRGIIASEDVTRSKPDPEPYLRGATLLGLQPAEIVAIEDSVGGILSAKRAGLRVIAVEHTYEKGELSVADLVVSAIKVITNVRVSEL